jgi:hypothetical protein
MVVSLLALVGLAAVFHGHPFTVGRVPRASSGLDPGSRFLRDIGLYHKSSILALSYSCTGRLARLGQMLPSPSCVLPHTAC